MAVNQMPQGSLARCSLALFCLMPFLFYSNQHLSQPGPSEKQPHAMTLVLKNLLARLCKHILFTHSLGALLALHTNLFTQYLSLIVLVSGGNKSLNR